MFESKPCRILQTAYIPVSTYRGNRIRVWNVNSPKSKGKLYSYALCENSTVSVGGSLSDVHEAACQLFLREHDNLDPANSSRSLR